MIQVSLLNKEDRVKEIIREIELHNKRFQSIIEPSILIQIVESIEDRIYFISESPSFEFKGRNWNYQQYKCDTIEDFKYLMDSHQGELYILYNIIMITNGVIPNTPGVSQNKSYMIRGVFMEDPLIKREQIINQILND